MTRLRLRHVERFVDNRLAVRHYFRRGKGARVALPGLPGSAEFMEAYKLALSADTAPAPTASVTGAAGTFRRLIAEWMASPEFKTSGAARTQYVSRLILEAFAREHGHRLVAEMQREHVVKIMGAKAATPAAANNWLKRFRRMMEYAVANGWRPDNPTYKVKPLKTNKVGFKPWSDALIAQYRAHHALGSKPRLAFELFLNFGQRRGDTHLIGPQHIRDNVLTIDAQEKTGVEVNIPVLAPLREAIAATPRGHLAFIVTDRGKPYSKESFGNWFHDQCAAAGIPEGYSGHGLRKAAARMHAEAGATTQMLMAWFGWLTMKEAERYTASADRKRLALKAGELMTAALDAAADAAK